MSNQDPKHSNKTVPLTSKQYTVLILKSIIAILLFGVIVFLMAGRLDYIQGWILLGICFLILSGSVVSFRNRKDLVKERRKPGPGVKKWDKIILIIYQLLLYCQIIIAILDSGRFRWSPSFSPLVYVLASLVLILAATFSFWALKTNNYFSSAVRIQTERGHRVVTNGPYQYIRHPGYTGIIFMVPALSLVLGSLWALIPAGMTVILFIIRTRLEDETLQKELADYSEYTEKIRFRLIPGIW